MLVLRPTTLAEALAMLAEHPAASLLAGGTDLLVEMNLHHHRPEVIVALRRVRELQRFDTGWIGAGVTYQRMERSGHAALAELARTVGSRQIRSVGTLGGNLGTASPAGDTLPFLAAADAEVVLASRDGERLLPWDAFLLGPKQQARRPGELVVGVRLPPLPARQAFAKVGVRRAMVIATVNCCVLRHDDGRTAIALGAVAPTVVRATAAEARASVGAIDDALLHDVADAVEGAVSPITDHRSTAAHRRRAAGVLARRTLERCA